MDPAEQSRLFDAAMVDVRAAYVSLNKVFKEHNKIYNVIEAHAHLDAALRQLGPDLLQSTIDENLGLLTKSRTETPPNTEPRYEVSDNVIAIAFTNGRNNTV